MRIHDSQLMADGVSRFHSSLRIWGWFFHPHDELVRVELSSADVIGQTYEVGMPYNGVKLATNTGWQLQTLLRTSNVPEQSELSFITRHDKKLSVKLADLINEGRARNWNEPFRRFREAVKSPDIHRILDVGGRARSRVDRKKSYPDKDVVAFDIVSGDNVDVVGDAHALSDHFASDYFDAVMSTSVFEHLLMPWKVALEIGKVLKPGGLTFIHTHQTIGMHDMPWDFWRFSSASWSALFNPATGFEVLSAAMGEPTFIIPFFWGPDRENAERSAGYGSSTVLARKTGAATVSWNVQADTLIDTKYPG